MEEDGLDVESQSGIDGRGGRGGNLPEDMSLVMNMLRMRTSLDEDRRSVLGLPSISSVSATTKGRTRAPTIVIEASSPDPALAEKSFVPAVEAATSSNAGLSPPSSLTLPPESLSLPYDLPSTSISTPTPSHLQPDSNQEEPDINPVDEVPPRPSFASSASIYSQQTHHSRSTTTSSSSRARHSAPSTSGSVIHVSNSTSNSNSHSRRKSVGFLGLTIGFGRRESGFG